VAGHPNDQPRVVRPPHLAKGDGRTTPKTGPNGIEVEESKIHEETELRRKVASNISVVEVNAYNHSKGGIGTRWSTIDTRVEADG
jgi:hypothetical protein